MSAQQTNLGIVVGVDGSPCSHTAVEWAARVRRCATLRSAWCRSCPGNNRPGRVGI